MKRPGRLSSSSSSSAAAVAAANTAATTASAITDYRPGSKASSPVNDNSGNHTPSSAKDWRSSSMSNLTRSLSAERRPISKSKMKTTYGSHTTAIDVCATVPEGVVLRDGAARDRSSMLVDPYRKSSCSANSSIRVSSYAQVCRTIVLASVPSVLMSAKTQLSPSRMCLRSFWRRFQSSS